VRVLVTGSSGFIGQCVDRELSAQGRQMFPFDGISDVRDRKAVRVAVEGCDAVINLAGVLGTAETVGAEQKAAEVNILGAVNVFAEAKMMGIPVVQIATGHRGQLNPYAITKGCAEDLALARAQWTGQQIAVVRAFHAYGPGQKAPPPHGRALVRKIIPSFVCRALSGMPLEINGTGSQIIDLVHVADVVKVLVDAIAGPYGEVLDAGTGVGTTVEDCAATVIEACGSTSEIVHRPMRKGEPDWSCVVAENPLAAHVWPYRLEDTVEHYRRLVKVAA
jgi:UDP-glucose 4-epimerase